MKQLMHWADTIAKSYRITETQHERMGTVPEEFTAESSGGASPLEAAESNIQTAQPMEGITKGSIRISPLDYYYCDNILKSTDRQPPQQEADHEMVSACSSGASPLEAANTSRPQTRAQTKQQRELALQSPMMIWHSTSEIQGSLMLNMQSKWRCGET